MTAEDAEEIRARVERALAHAGEQPWLVGYDASGIQELVTAAGRPLSMRGVSEVIKEFDRQVDEDSRGLTIFAGGGRGICLARSQDGAHEMARALAGRFRKETHHGVLATGYVPLDRGAEAQSLRWLRRHLDIEKDAADIPTPPLPDLRELECVYCRRYRGIPRMRDDTEELVCSRCDDMIKHGRKTESAMSRSLADIARRNDGSVGPIAAVSADGNELGALFDSIESLVALAAVSRAVAGVFGHAHQEAMRNVPEERRLSLVIGGDDVRVFLAPGYLLRYVAALGQAVEREAEAHARVLRPLIGEDMAGRLAEIGIGIGAVVADTYFPAWRLMEYAHELEVNAKRSRNRAGERSRRSTFDFAVIKDEAMMSGMICNRRRDCRPLSLEQGEWQAVMERVDALKDLPNQQQILAAEDTMSEEELGNLLRYQVARSDKWQAFYEACGVNWRDPQAVVERRPDRGLLELRRLKELPS
jgi:hypothetical protein